MADILYGKPVVEQIKTKLADSNKKLKLVTVGFSVSEWLQYTSSLEKSAVSFCVNVENRILEKEDDIFQVVNLLSADNSVNGIMVQQPLDKKLNAVCDLIPVEKDVDCLSLSALEKLYHNTARVASATPTAVLRLLQFYNVSLAGKHVVIVGRGNAVGKPLALLMLNNNATVTVCHSKTINLKDVCKTADILVSCCGVPHLIDDTFVSENTVVIDVGLSFVDGKAFGDVNTEKIANCCKAYSPVPGGVGPVTRACVFDNLFTLSLL